MSDLAKGLELARSRGCVVDDLQKTAASTFAHLSVAQDLQAVSQTIELLIDHPDDNSWRNSVLGQAVLSHAITMYGRAAQSKDRKRGVRNQVSFTKFLNEQQRAVHTLVCELRNRQVAHYGASDDSGPCWTKEALTVLLIDGLPVNAGFAFSRASWKTQLADDLRKLAVHLHARVVDEARRLMTDLVLTLLRKVSADEVLKVSLEERSFDAAAFFDDQLAAREFMERALTGGVMAGVSKRPEGKA